MRNLAAMRATFTVVLDRELDGRAIASVPGIPGCHAYGRTPGAAIRRVRSVLRCHVKETLRAGGKVPKQPRPITVEIELAL